MAFPNEEASAALIVDRLGVSGIAARIDRGLHGSWQVAARGHISVMVDARDAARARRVLGVPTLPDQPPSQLMRVAVVLLIAVLGFGLAALLIEVVR